MVDKPVVLARYGTGGGAAFWVGCAAPCSSIRLGRISPADNDVSVSLRIGMTALTSAASPWKLTFLGGGPKLSGSLRVARGRELWSVAFKELVGSLPWPTHPAYPSLC